MKRGTTPQFLSEAFPKWRGGADQRLGGVPAPVVLHFLQHRGEVLNARLGTLEGEFLLEGGHAGRRGHSTAQASRGPQQVPGVVCQEHQEMEHQELELNHIQN